MIELGYGVEELAAHGVDHTYGLQILIAKDPAEARWMHDPLNSSLSLLDLTPEGMLRSLSIPA